MRTEAPSTIEQPAGPVGDPERLYRACLAQDTRFDGRFFMAVTTTGIYCRPTCPAPKPKRRNVRFYPSAAAAASAGFRPCRRCRPESAPGSAGWRGSSAVVTRALRLIEDGVLEPGGLDRFASQLGVGPRQLRRLFAEHVGASPTAVAQTQRLHFAKKLIDETELPMSAVAVAAGFPSVRRFNAALRATYGMAPTELRRARRPANRGHSAGEIELRLSFRGPYDWPAMLAFLGPRCAKGVECVDGAWYRRTIRLESGTGALAASVVNAQDRHLVLRLRLPEAGSLYRVVRRARRMFDLDADPLAIQSCFRDDPILGPLAAARPGVRVPVAWDPFELGVRAILGQQVSVKAATTLAARLVAGHGDPLPEPGGGLTHLFPTAERLAEADLDGIGLTTSRARSLRTFARAVAEGQLSLDDAGNLEELVDRLVAIPGVGDWTAQYIAMRGIGETDAFPAGDLGLRSAVTRDGRRPTTAMLEQRSQAWRPWRATAALYLWTRPVS